MQANAGTGAAETESMLRNGRAPLPVSIRVLNVPEAPGPLRVAAGAWLIGAGSSADLVINQPTVSRRHLAVELVAEGVLLRDLGSRNGTFYLGQRVRELVVTPGTRVRLGNVEIAIELDASALADVDEGPARYGELVGAAPVMRQLFGMLERLEGSLVNVLIEGESGTGKELLARAIHRSSPVAAGPLIAINCGAIHPTLVQSELFGHKKGAFTGAGEARLGAFQAADGGTLFLDEVGELPLDVQPMLLRVLEERAVTPLGENRVRPVRVRVLAATNRTLRERISAGAFRDDLYYRLNVVNLKVPPLRERGEDVALLARLFAKNAGVAELPASILREICERSWPGNARELRHAVECYVVMGALPEFAALSRPALAHLLCEFADITRPYQELKDTLLEAFTRSYVSRLVESTHGNISEASRISGLERSYLNKLSNRLGVKR